MNTPVLGQAAARLLPLTQGWGQGRRSPLGTTAQGNQPTLPQKPQLQGEIHNQRTRKIWAEISRFGFPLSGASPGPAPAQGRTICHQRAAARQKRSAVPPSLDTPPARGKASAGFRLWLLLHHSATEIELKSLAWHLQY